ncbi:hypothetical protein P3L10_015329 [Capsicum annuum]
MQKKSSDGRTCWLFLFCFFVVNVFGSVGVATFATDESVSIFQQIPYLLQLVNQLLEYPFVATDGAPIGRNQTSSKAYLIFDNRWTTCCNKWVTYCKRWVTGCNDKRCSQKKIK